LIYQTIGFSELYPYKIKIEEPAQQAKTNPLTVKFKLFDSTYQNQVTESGNIQFIVKATEANDYDENAEQTIINGTNPVYQDDYWQSQINLPDYGKYRIAVKAKDVFWPKDSIVINYPASADFTVVDVRPPSTDFSIEPQSPDGQNGWYLNPATITLTPDEEATTYYSWDSGAEQTYSEPLQSAEGKHLLSFYSIDRFENIELKKFQEIKVDTQKPVISEESPKGLIDYNPSISAKLTDASSGIDESSINLRLDGIQVETTFDTETSLLTYIPPQPISGGVHQVNLEFSDDAGNNASLNWDFEVDATPPQTTLKSLPAEPAPSGWFDTQASISLSSNEDGTIYYRWDNEPEQSQTVIAEQAVEIGNAPAGEHTLFVYSKDKIGNVEQLNSKVFKVDLEEPSISNNTPTGLIYNFRPQISAVLADASSGLDESSIELKVDNNLVAASFNPTDSLLTYTPGTNLSQGRHQVDLSVSDKAGRVSNKSWRFTIIGTQVSGWIYTDTTWEADASPYIVVGDVYVASGATLTIEPATAIKFQSKKKLTNFGSLQALGTADNKITFTSIKNDSVIGDTNQDGNATSPAPRDWGYIDLGSNSTLDNSVVNYAGSDYEKAIAADSSTTIQNSTISNSGTTAIYGRFGTNVRIINNVIENNWGNGIQIGRFWSGYPPNSWPTIVNNVIRYNSSGIYLMGARPVALEGNDISFNSNYGINANQSSIKDIGANTGSGNTPGGVYLGESFADESIINLPKSLSPYVIWRTLRVENINIEAGSVVKFGVSANAQQIPSKLQVDGRLSAAGGPTDKIYFTSLADDSIGGDTNRDGNTTMPASGNWGSIELNGSVASAVIDNAVIRYGGVRGNSIEGSAAINFTNSELSDGAGDGLRSNGSQKVTISNNRFERIGSSAIYVGPSSKALIANNIIENNGGNGITAGFYYSPGQNTLAEPSINGNSIRSNSGAGVSLNYARPFAMEGNDISLNRNYGIYAANGSGIKDPANNTGSGNTPGGVYLGEAYANDTVVNFPAYFSPYVIWRGFNADNLNIEPGSVVKFGVTTEAWQIPSKLSISGRLDMNGTTNDKIYLTSVNDDSVGGDTNNNGNATSPAAGNWGSVELNGNIASAGIDNAIVRYGGIRGQMIEGGELNITNSIIAYSSGEGIEIDTTKDNVISNNNIENNVNGIKVAGIQPGYGTPAVYSKATVTQNTFRNNSNDGINVRYGSIPRAENNNFVGNSRYPIYLQNSLIEKVLQNTGSDNGFNWIYLTQSQLDGSSIIDGKNSLPFYVFDALRLRSGQTTDVFGGTVFKFGNNARFDVDGTFNALATPTDLIYFTSIKDDSIGGDTNNDGSATTPSRGDWDGISFNYGSDNSVIKNAEIEYGGGAGANISVSSNATVDSVRINNADTAISLSSAGGNITNNTITDSTTGIEAFGNNYAYVGNNTLANNATGVKVNTNSYANFYYNTINNGSNGIYFDDFSASYLGGNTISGNTKGIYADYSSLPMIVGNSILFNPSGLYLIGASPTVKSNTISSNTIGLEAYEGGSQKIVGNNISANAEGLHFASASPKVYSNTISSNGMGINSFSSANLDIQKNSINSNSIGIRMDSSSTADTKMNNINSNSTAGVETHGSSQIYLHDNNIQSNDIGVSAYEASSPTANYNNIFGNGSFNIANYKAPTGDPPTVPIIDAKNNWWNSTAQQAIENSLNNKDSIEFAPWLMAPTPTDKCHLDDKKKLTVVTYNTHSQNSNSFINEVQTGTGDNLAGSTPTIAGLQEVSQGQYNNFSVDNSTFSSQYTSIYNSIALSPDFSITSQAKYDYDIDGSNDGKRVFQKVTASLNGEPITVFNTHLPTDDNNDPNTFRAYQMLSGDGIAQKGVIDLIASGGNTVVFTLDSNNHYYEYATGGFVDPESGEGRQYRQLWRLKDEAGFEVDSHSNITQQTPGSLGVNIDYVFYKGLTEENSMVLTSISGSDHWPVRVTFSYE